jgi:tripartite-type tricarboxylate transporter receptor subunit TctC
MLRRDAVKLYVHIICFCAAITFIGIAQAQDYPSRPITVVVASPPGGMIDPVMRIIQTQMAEALGQPVVVENRAGAGGNTGAAFVARSAPDGYTFLMTTNAVLTIHQFLYKTMPFDVLTDLSPVATIAKGSLVFAAHKSIPINSVAELISFAKQNPKELTYGTAGFGSPFHIAGEFFKQRAGIEMVHVPFSGGAPLAQALLGGHVKFAVTTLASIAPFVQDGSVRLIAIMDKERIPNYPYIQTISETVPNIEASAWSAVMAPAGTPRPIVDRVNGVITQALNDEANRTKIAALGQSVMADTPAKTTELIKLEQRQWADVIRAMGIEPQ